MGWSCDRDERVVAVQTREADPLHVCQIHGPVPRTRDSRSAHVRAELGRRRRRDHLGKGHADLLLAFPLTEAPVGDSHGGLEFLLALCIQNRGGKLLALSVAVVVLDEMDIEVLVGGREGLDWAVEGRNPGGPLGSGLFCPDRRGQDKHNAN